MFHRYLRAAHHEHRQGLVTLLVGLCVLAAWGGWFVLARVPVYETSSQARLEAETASHEVDAPVAGQIIAHHVVLGDTVEKGALLFELDAQTLKLQAATEQARLDHLGPQMEALGLELGQDERAFQDEIRVTAASLGEARARERAADALARQTLAEREQVDLLRAREAVSALESARQRTDAEQKAAEFEATRRAVDRLDGERRVRQSDRRARMERKRLELAVLRGEAEQSRARLRALDREIERRQVRAPISGRIGAVEPLRAGAVVEEGQRLAVIVPSGEVRAIAFFEPSAVGRLRPGQSARLRMQGFPWTKYGTIAAQVARVGNEPSRGLVRVELDVSVRSNDRIPIEHGLPGRAEVQVERLSPLSLAMDAAGRYLGSVERTARRMP